jgi:hypothetical protein
MMVLIRSFIFLRVLMHQQFPVREKVFNNAWVAAACESTTQLLSLQILQQRMCERPACCLRLHFALYERENANAG